MGWSEREVTLSSGSSSSRFLFDKKKKNSDSIYHTWVQFSFGHTSIIVSIGNLSSEMWHIKTSVRELDRRFSVLKLGRLHLIRYENNHTEPKAWGGGSRNYKIYPIIPIIVSI